MYCVYCDQEHSDGTPIDDEHIVPVALGGLNSFTIRVCKTSNSTLGNRVDDRFISLPFITNDRYFLDLASHRGKPTIDLSGVSNIGGRECELRYTITGGEKLMKIAKPSVERVRNADGTEHIQVFGDPMDAQRILLGKLAAAEQEGKTLRDEHGNVLTKEGIEALIAQKSVVHENPSVLIEWRPSAYDTVPFFCKVALGTCFYLLGEPFGRSETARRLRSVVLAERDEDIDLPGMFWPLVDSANDVYRFFKVPDTHVLALTPKGDSVFVISLFGGKYTAAIPLQDGLSNSTFTVPKDGCALQIDLRAREFKKSSFAEYILQKPWLRPDVQAVSSRTTPIHK